MARRSDSTIARINLAQHNEDLVVAENSLQGERIVSWVRLALLILIGASQNLGDRLSGVIEPDGITPATVAILLYQLFTVAHLIGIYRVKRDPLRAKYIPLLSTLIDFAFYLFMGAHQTFGDGAPYHPEREAAVFGVLIVFSIARYHWIHVATSAVLACGSFLALAAIHDRLGDFAPNLFVIGCYVTLAILVGLTRSRTRRMFVQLRQRDALTRFLPPQVAERVMKLGSEALAPVQREVTVMFTDIRDFTSYSESLPPAAVLHFLDGYFGHMAQLVKAHEGMVNKFLGDGMLAIWGVPETLDGHAEKALRCALDMRRVLDELNRVREQTGAPPIRIGIGIHTGVVAAGMLGGADQQEYTVIGDAVNLASRIEGLTKSLGCDLLVSEATWEQVEGQFQGQRIAESQVKGRKEPVTLYRVDRLVERSPASALG